MQEKRTVVLPFSYSHPSSISAMIFSSSSEFRPVSLREAPPAGPALPLLFRPPPPMPVGPFDGPRERTDREGKGKGEGKGNISIQRSREGQGQGQEQGQGNRYISIQSSKTRA